MLGVIDSNPNQKLALKITHAKETLTNARAFSPLCMKGGGDGPGLDVPGSSIMAIGAANDPLMAKRPPPTANAKH